MVYRRERPRCRQVIIELCNKYECTPEELLHHPQFSLSHNLRVQCCKMIEEVVLK